MGASGLGALLVKEGFLSEQDRITITKTCGQGSWAFAKGILSTGLLDEDELSAFFAERTRFSVAPKDLLSQLDPAVIEHVDRRMISRLEMLPIEVDHHRITVAVADPLDKATIKQLEFFTGLDVITIIAPLSQIYEGLSRLDPDFKPQLPALSNFLRNHAGTAWIKQKVADDFSLSSVSASKRSNRSAELDNFDESDIEDVDLEDVEDSSEIDDFDNFDDISSSDNSLDLEMSDGSSTDDSSFELGNSDTELDDSFDSFDNKKTKPIAKYLPKQSPDLDFIDEDIDASDSDLGTEQLVTKAEDSPNLEDFVDDDGLDFDPPNSKELNTLDDEDFFASEEVPASKKMPEKKIVSQHSNADANDLDLDDFMDETSAPEPAPSPRKNPAPTKISNPIRPLEFAHDDLSEVAEETNINLFAATSDNLEFGDSEMEQVEEITKINLSAPPSEDFVPETRKLATIPKKPTSKKADFIPIEHEVDEDFFAAIDSSSQSLPEDPPFENAHNSPPKSAIVNGASASLTATAKANEALLRLSLCFDHASALAVAKEYLPQISSTGCLVRLGKTTEALATWRKGARSTSKANQNQQLQRIAATAKTGRWSHIAITTQDDLFAPSQSLRVYKLQNADGSILVLAGDYPVEDETLQEALTSFAEQLSAK